MNIHPEFTSPYLLGVNKESQENPSTISTISTKTIDSAAASAESHHPDLIGEASLRKVDDWDSLAAEKVDDWDSLAAEIDAITKSIHFAAGTPRDNPGEVLIEEVLIAQEFPSPPP